MLEGLTPPPKFKGSCKVGKIADSLDEKDKAIFTAAINDVENWGVKTLSKALSDRGIQLSDSPIYNHRSKTCACFRS